MGIHSSILAWRIPWTEEPIGLQSMRSQRVGQNWATNTYTLSQSIRTIHLSALTDEFAEINT